MFQPRSIDAPHKIFEAANFSSGDPLTAKEYNFSNSATLRKQNRNDIMNQASQQT
jgi:hypothetical protein